MLTEKKSCAIRHNSPEYLNQRTKMHKLLSNAKVFVCEDLWTDLIITQVDSQIRVHSDRAVVKVTAVDESLHVYVPDDEDGLYSCYCSELPSVLAKTLGIGNERAEKSLYRLLLDRMDLGTIMKDEDLPDYDWIEKLPDQQLSYLSRPDGILETSHDDAPGTQTGVESATKVLVATRSESSQQQIVTQTPALTLSMEMPVYQRIFRDLQYQKLLKEVMRQAKLIGGQKVSELSLAEINEALDNLDGAQGASYRKLESLFGGHSSWAENKAVGAAGELFVSVSLFGICGG